MSIYSNFLKLADWINSGKTIPSNIHTILISKWYTAEHYSLGYDTVSNASAVPTGLP
jgi:hypothetical protein